MPAFLERVLSAFPAGAHELTLVRDPDEVLADEVLRARLTERGFRLVAEVDPIALRLRLEQAKPIDQAHPLIVITADELATLPYDLWSRGHRVELGLQAFFPNLVYPIVRTLSPAQRARLATAAAPAAPLGRRATVEHVLRHALDGESGALTEPGGLVAWLDDQHGRGEPVPEPIVGHLLGELSNRVAFAGWPLAELLRDRDAFRAFVRRQWARYVSGATGERIADADAAYLLRFAEDPKLQDGVTRLARTGALAPVELAAAGSLPPWARPAVVASSEDRLARQLVERRDQLAERLAALPTDPRWPDWHAPLRAWAELTALRYTPGARPSEGVTTACDQLGASLDAAFGRWLRDRYASLAGQRLPTPHHVHHVPDYMAWRHRQGAERVALIVLDALGLADWYVIGVAWRARHPAWRLEERLLLAQLPTLTAISRQALVAGRRPSDFGATIGDNSAEGAHWEAFWAAHDIPARACGYASVMLDRAEPPPVVTGSAMAVLCLVERSLDDLLHGTTHGDPQFYASLRVWLETTSRRLERLIEELLGRGFVVFLASDHGHVTGRGTGQPNEGVLVRTRSRRARVFSDRRLAESVAASFPRAFLWGNDDLLPPEMWALLAPRGEAFAPYGQTIVTHGGAHVDEVVVPFITVEAA